MESNKSRKVKQSGSSSSKVKQSQEPETQHPPLLFLFFSCAQQKNKKSQDKSRNTTFFLTFSNTRRKVKDFVSSPITVVINSWNETCYTCKKQVKILDQAEEKFKDILFLSFEQTKDKEIAKFLKIEYWTTIVIYKNNKEISRSIGETDKSKIYSRIIESL